MAIYNIDITEQTIRTVEVEAPSLEDAISQTRQAWMDEDIVLDSSDFFDATFTEARNE